MGDVGELRAPFPWFGGKSRCADVVWRAFGNPPNYVEPFFGSGAVLLGRPHEPKIETVNDLDCHLANFWRAVTFAPDDVARWCDWPVNEADLHARHRWLVEPVAFREHQRRMRHEAEYFDAKRAGWWVWGLSMWIGGGWCASAELGESERRPGFSGGGGGGVHALGQRNAARSSEWAARPDLSGNGQGVVKPTEKMPRVSSRVNGRASPRGHTRLIGEQMPNLHGFGGNGVLTSRLPSLGNERGVHGASKPPCTEWFRALQARLRRVRVCCGDWKRVLGDSVIGTTKSRNSGMNPCGIFLDPPYSGEERAADLYGVDDGHVAKDVAAWAIAHGDDPDLRIAVCGYEGEHVFLDTWTCHAWKAHRGYASEDNDNKLRERIWFSPHCLPLDPPQRALFAT